MNYWKLTLNPAEIDFMIGYFNPSVVSSSGSHKLKEENVNKLEPLTNKRALLMPAFSVHLCGNDTPISIFFNLMKLISLSHQVDGAALLAKASLLNLGQNTF